MRLIERKREREWGMHPQRSLRGRGVKSYTALCVEDDSWLMILSIQKLHTQYVCGVDSLEYETSKWPAGIVAEFMQGKPPPRTDSERCKFPDQRTTMQVIFICAGRRKGLISETISTTSKQTFTYFACCSRTKI